MAACPYKDSGRSCFRSAESLDGSMTCGILLKKINKRIQNTKIISKLKKTCLLSLTQIQMYSLKTITDRRLLVLFQCYLHNYICLTTLLVPQFTPLLPETCYSTFYCNRLARSAPVSSKTDISRTRHPLAQNQVTLIRQSQ